MAAAKQYLAVEQVARRLNLPGEVVEGLLDRHELPGLRLGAAWLVPDSALEEFLDTEFARQNPGIARASQEMRAKAGPVIKPRTKGRTNAVKLLFLGRELDMPSYSAAAVWVIEELAAKDAGFLHKLAERRRGGTRFVSEERAGLYSKSPGRAARRMRNGWWIGTNHNRGALEQMLRAACEIAGLRFGVDLVVTEARPAKLPPRSAARAFVGRGRSGLGDLARRHDDYLNEP